MSLSDLLPKISLDEFDQMSDDELASTSGLLKYSLTAGSSVPKNAVVFRGLAEVDQYIKSAPAKKTLKFTQDYARPTLLGWKLISTGLKAQMAADEYYRADIEEDIKQDSAIMNMELQQYRHCLKHHATQACTAPTWKRRSR